MLTPRSQLIVPFALAALLWSGPAPAQSPGGGAAAPPAAAPDAAAPARKSCSDCAVVESIRSNRWREVPRWPAPVPRARRLACSAAC